MKKQNIKPNVVRGGIAVPLGRNYYYMSGRKHKNGGIDIGNNPRTGLEVEDGEVMHVSDNEIKVFSSVPFLNGESPAEKVMGGENPNDVFNAQESYKKRNKINDDGTKKKRNGGKEKPKFDDWYKTVPKEINDTTSYNLRRAYELLPYDELETWRTRKGHLRSVAPTENGDYEFLKSKNHPTYQKEIDWYNSPDAASFREEYTLDDSTEYPKYRKRNKKRMGDKRNNNDSLRTELSIIHPQYKNGGLSRSKDYGSKFKPYPSVKSGDFAGGHRSYPIPTKADAVDALRLAGLHGRSDVKSKVYSKYPELRKKAKVGGLYSVTVNGKTRMRMIPSTGEKSKAEFGINYKLPNIIGINPNENNKYVEKMLAPINELVSNTRQPYATKQNNSRIIKTRNLFSNIKNPFEGITSNDKLSLASNVIGSGISTAINASMLNKLKTPNRPISVPAAKLKTRININPQLDKMRETLTAYEKDIDNNTTSSNVALARKQNARFANMLQTNELYGNKENAETELINKDKLNQQTVAAENIKQYNDWNDKVVAFNNTIAEKRAENNVSLIESLNQGIQDVIGRTEKRNAEDKTIVAMADANPHLPLELFYEQGLISKKIYDKVIKLRKSYKKESKD